MTPLRLRDRAKRDIEAKANELAVANGASRDKTLEQLRFTAGVVEGLRQAGEILDQILKTAGEDD